MKGRDWLIARGVPVVEGDPFNDSDVSEPTWVPTQYACGYTLDLYCDRQTKEYMHNSDFPHSFFGETFADCARQARARGWVIHRKTRTATCPRCTIRKGK
jgi:hypothetical protein